MRTDGELVRPGVWTPTGSLGHQSPQSRVGVELANCIRASSIRNDCIDRPEIRLDPTASTKHQSELAIGRGPYTSTQDRYLTASRPLLAKKLTPLNRGSGRGIEHALPGTIRLPTPYPTCF
jgi:hypothetical protein